MSMRRRSLHKDEGGAVYAEFLIAFPPMLLMFLAMLQLALMYSARLAVRHAAYRAARAAIVVIPDDPDRHGGEPAYKIDYDSAGGGEESSFELSTGSGRLKAIRTAGSFPLLGFAPPLARVTGETSLGDAYSLGAADLFGGAAYTLGATAVTFPEEPGGMAFRESFDMREMVTTRLTYLFTCTIPIVTRRPFNMCYGPMDMLAGAPDVLLEGAVGELLSDDVDPWVELGFDTYRDWLRGREEMANGLEELRFSGNPALLVPFVLRGQRFLILRAEASLPLQGAEYGPKSGRDSLGGDD